MVVTIIIFIKLVHHYNTSYSLVFAVALLHGGSRLVLHFLITFFGTFFVIVIAVFFVIFSFQIRFHFRFLCWLPPSS
jgi:hypothetical protein